jgi:hypothetical protein
MCPNEVGVDGKGYFGVWVARFGCGAGRAVRLGSPAPNLSRVFSVLERLTKALHSRTATQLLI